MKKYLILLFCAIILASCTLFLSTAHADSHDFNLIFISCNASGKEKTVFQLEEDVYIKGGIFPTNREVSIYVIPNHKALKPENAVSGPVNQTVTSHSLPITQVWNSASEAGQYDVWIDVNQNGKFDSSDRYHYILRFYQLLVVPEYLLGSIAAVALPFAAYAIFRLRKFRQQKF